MDPIDDHNNYKFGLFYFNRADRRAIVPKRIRPFGFTINFGRPEAPLVLIACILMAVIIMNLFDH
jgi:uncharacterized membrane protein